MWTFTDMSAFLDPPYEPDAFDVWYDSLSEAERIRVDIHNSTNTSEEEDEAIASWWFIDSLLDRIQTERMI